ncbi:Crp/Fnr family transcriptional regulator [Erythrobacter sp. SD-21]|uniref:Crp/Fnr family transcriptional regulator n=1 Tax=Erythrobacter sp. SD-21 TaxID=161528 RepID=UPI0018DE8912|nr:Crp/Fnr family transcriptional regulator [Erythrobacter sp. SD-21]
MKLQDYEMYRQIVSEGELTNHCALIVSGCASRFKTLANGERQINSFHFRGDMVDLQSALMLKSDHSIRTHSPCRVARIECRAVLQLAQQFPEWARVLWFDTLVDAAIFREWTLNVGRRSAVSRVAHLLLEIAHRLQDIGESDGYEFQMPVTQTDLADAAGLSAVHTNRSLQTLRQRGLVRSFGRTMIVLDMPAMCAEAGFDRNYLYPAGPRGLPAAV